MAGPGTISAATRTRAAQGERPDLAGKVTVPDVLFQAHSAPLNIAFYDGDDFPGRVPGRRLRHHARLVEPRQRAPATRSCGCIFEDGKPTGEYEDFMTGFVVSDEQVWGRPVGVAVAKDGSLIVTEDGSGTIWRVSHEDARS